MDKNTLVKVKNRDNGSVGYKIPDLGIVRNFQPGEIKEITIEELTKLHYIAGGDYIIENCLLIENEEVLKTILENKDIEPEYFYTEKEIKELLLYGTLDELLDCLDFAPKGVVDLVKHIAVQIKLNDIEKREAILAKTGFNVTTAVDINKETSGDKKEEAPKRRVVNEEKKDDAPVRRTNPTGKYSIKN